MCQKWEFALVSIYKDWNGKFWLRNLDLPTCVTGCHTDGSGRGKVVTGGYAGVVIKIPILVPPVLLCWWWMMMMMVVQWGLTIVVCLTAGGWWRTYKGFLPHLWMNEWLGLTVVWCLIHFLVGGGGVITSYISFMGHSVGPLSFPFGGSTSATQVHFTQQ